MENTYSLRSEYKYLTTNNDLELIEEKLSRILELDSHTNSINKNYIIHSLYFDDMNNTCMKDNDAGLGKRFKYRIRYYNDNLENLFLEKKEKINGLGHKIVCKISKEDYDNLINGNEMDVFWNTQNNILKKFCIDINTRFFKPKIIIDYERTAYVEPITNVRVTFDRNISCSKGIDNFLDREYIKYPLLNTDRHILEVKFDSVLPSYIIGAVEATKACQTSFSKYYLSRMTYERN